MSNATTAPLTDPQYVGWTPAPTRRGTINIIWSCLSVLLLCSYKCVYLDIPSDDVIHAGWHTFRGIPLWPEWPMIRRLLLKLKCMLAIVVAPEVGVWWAGDEFIEARNALCAAKKMGRGYDGSGTAMECRTTNTESPPASFDRWIADKLRRKGGDSALPVHRRREDKTQNKLTMAHAFYANMGGFVFTSGAASNVPNGQHRLDTLGSAATLSTYVEFLQNIEPAERRDLFVKSAADIQSLGKSDALTKALAILQVLYLALDCLGRTAQGLPISLLELSTVGYVVAAAVMYCFWWDKPYDACLVTILQVEPRRNDTREEEYTLQQHIDHATKQLAEQQIQQESQLEAQREDLEDAAVLLLSMITAMAFGAVHLAAWNWLFFSHAARLVWRVSSIITTAGPLWALYLWAIATENNPLNKDKAPVGLTKFNFCHAVVPRGGREVVESVTPKPPIRTGDTTTMNSSGTTQLFTTWHSWSTILPSMPAKPRP